jgi:hypothetical protein
VERSGLQAEKLRSAAAAADPPRRRLQRAQDGEALRLAEMHDLAVRPGERTGYGRWRFGAGRAVFEREKFLRDERAARQDDRPLDDVLQLADVAPPMVAHQPLHGSCRQAGRGHAQPFGDATKPLLGEERDVVTPVAQGGHSQREHAEPVEEIGTEPSAVHGGLEILIRCSDHPDVDVEGRGAADAPDLALLEHAQQLRLGAQREIADLVEEQRAAVRQLERAGRAADRVGEGAFLVAEKLALDERLRQRRAVHGDERTPGAATVLVDGLGDALLAGAGLTHQQHRGVTPCDQPHLVEHVLEGTAASDDGARVARRRLVARPHLHPALSFLARARRTTSCRALYRVWRFRRPGAIP